MADSSDQEVNLAASALAISLVALFATILQLAQQSVTSAAGYTKCGAKVLDYWAKSRKLRVRWTQFRLEVKLETPVMFVCQPTNRNFPLRGDDAYFLEGDKYDVEQRLVSRWLQASLKYRLFGKFFGGATPATRSNTAENGPAADGTWLPTFKAEKKPEVRRSNTLSSKRVNTTDAELASWVRLYDGIEEMEINSAEWQDTQYNLSTGPPAPGSPSGTARAREAMQSRSLIVAMQAKERTWDTMPSALTKPFATTTMCHMVEMLALLNVHWQEFDRTHDRYRAEGNGFVVTGEKITDLGLTFSFQKYGTNRFKENRVIPVDGVKDLCFGKADTIFCESIDPTRLEAAEIESIGSLQLSTKHEIAETLRVIGCNTNTVNIFLEENRTTHIFPVAFELIGMLARTFHIKHTLFRYLPNPTKFTFDRRAFSIREMLMAYADLLKAESSENVQPGPVKRKILDHLLILRPYLQRMGLSSERNNKGQFLEPSFLLVLHDALDDMDQILTGKEKPPYQGGANDEKSEKKDKTISETPEQKERRQMVRDVLRSHLQNVLYMLNREEEDQRTPRQSRANWKLEHRFQIESLQTMSTMDDIDAAPPEGTANKQKLLMEVYFKSIRRITVENAKESTLQRSKANELDDSGLHVDPLRSGLKHTPTEPTSPTSPASPTSSEASVSGVQRTQLSPVQPRVSIEIGPTAGARTTAPSEQEAKKLAELEVNHDDLWCVLIFRMMCWLTLHDFHKKDRQLPNSELLGSRLPVFIA